MLTNATSTGFDAGAVRRLIATERSRRAAIKAMVDTATHYGLAGVTIDFEALPASMHRVYGQGVVVNVLNPKTALFFVAFLPQFVEPGRGPLAVQVLVLGLCFIGLGLLSDSTYAVAAGAIAPRLRRRRTREGPGRGQRASGAIYVALGVLAAVAHRPEPA
jgi:threonine/homoserine/homoserine lactone efflux protein